MNTSYGEKAYILSRENQDFVWSQTYASSLEVTLLAQSLRHNGDKILPLLSCSYQQTAIFFTRNDRKVITITPVWRTTIRNWIRTRESFSCVCFLFSGWSFFIPSITVDTFVPMTWEITAVPHSLYILSLWYLIFFYRNWTSCNVEVIWKLVVIRLVKNLPSCVSDKNAYGIWEGKTEGKRQRGRP